MEEYRIVFGAIQIHTGRKAGDIALFATLGSLEINDVTAFALLIEQGLGIELSGDDVYPAQTVAGLIQKIREKSRLALA